MPGRRSCASYQVLYDEQAYEKDLLKKGKCFEHLV